MICQKEDSHAASQQAKNASSMKANPVVLTDTELTYLLTAATA